MEELSKLTETELLKRINDLKTKYDVLKQEIIDDSVEIDNATIKINDKLEVLENYEKNYIDLVQEISKR